MKTIQVCGSKFHRGHNSPRCTAWSRSVRPSTPSSESWRCRADDRTDVGECSRQRLPWTSVVCEAGSSVVHRGMQAPTWTSAPNCATNRPYVIHSVMMSRLCLWPTKLYTMLGLVQSFQTRLEIKSPVPIRFDSKVTV